MKYSNKNNTKSTIMLAVFQQINVNMLVFSAHNVFVIEVTSHRKISVLVFVIAHLQLWLRQNMKGYD